MNIYDLSFLKKYEVNTNREYLTLILLSWISISTKIIEIEWYQYD